MPPKRKLNANTTKNTSDKKPKMVQSTLMTPPSSNGQWKISDSLLIYTHPEVKPCAKILAMDMDNTLISTASGKTFPVDCNDWKLFSPVIPEKLKEFHDRGYKLVIISNQYGIAKGYVKVPDFQTKIEKVVRRIGAPMQAFFSILPDHNRKPDTGMWECLVNAENGGVAVDTSTSIYCGDAAGRPAQGSRKKDHSCGDRLFAMNLSLRFLTPEQLWFDQKDPGPFSLPSFDPRSLLALSNRAKLPAFSTPKKTEMLILVGFPGAGKSHLCNHVLQPLGYTIVNRDTLGTWQKCVKVCEETLQQGTSVVIDNTNVDLESRGRYIKVAAKLTCPVRCLVMETNFEQSKHNERPAHKRLMLHRPNRSPCSTKVYRERPMTVMCQGHGDWLDSHPTAMHPINAH